MIDSQVAVNQVVSQGSNVSLYGGAATAFTLWGLHLSELGVIVSSSVAVIGLAVQVWVRWRQDKRDREFHLVRMETLRNDAEASRRSRQETRID